jgi:DNA-binding response OmpR family regulator
MTTQAKDASRDAGDAGTIASVPAILVIHDDPAMLYWLQRHLTRAGYRVITDSDMFQALYRLRDDRTPRMLIADWHLGEHDAAVLVHVVRQRDPEFPVIVVTAYPERLDRIRSRLPDDVVVLFSPLEESRLLAQVRAHWRDEPPEPPAD